MKYLILITALGFFGFTSQPPQQNIIGTWQLVANTIIIGDSVNHKDLSGHQMIKMFNDSHFSFFNHDILSNTDSTVVDQKMFTAGSGRYTLVDDQYVEYLEYCTYRPLEGREFHFKLTLKGDTLIQTGHEKIESLNIDQEIIEKYVRL
jgi:hypothetical protein